MRVIVLLSVIVISVYAQDSYDNTGVRLALELYDNCSKADGLSPCLKKNAITMLDNLGRMDNLTLADGIVCHKNTDAPEDGPAVTEEQLDQSLPRSSDAKDAALTEMLFDKISNFIGSRSIEVALPKISASELIEAGRKGDFDFDFGGSGNKKGGKRRKGGKGGKGGKKGMMEGMMMLIGAKLAALIPLSIGVLFFIAKKALITAKIALLISGIIAFQKLFGNKKMGMGGSGHSESGGGISSWLPGGGGGSGWQAGGGGGGGWQSGGGGYDRRSSNEPQTLVYNAYSQ